MTGGLVHREEKVALMALRLIGNPLVGSSNPFGSSYQGQTMGLSK